MGGFMFGIFYRSKSLFALLFTVVLFSGYYISETTNDPDRIDAENLINADNAPVLTEFNTNTVSDLNTGVILNNRTNSEPVLTFGSLDTFTITNNPGAPNNGGSPNWAIFYDLIAGSRDIEVTQMSSGNTGVASAPFTVEVFTRAGTALGGPVNSGPGSSTAGWTSLGVVPAVQGATTNDVSLVFTLPNILVGAGDTVGVAIKFNTVGPRYFGTGSPPLTTISDTNLTLITGEARSAPFTTGGSWFSSRALTGVIRYVVNTITGVINTNTGIPGEFRLAQNYPNPFNPSTTIEFAIPNISKVSLKVYNVHGQEVTTLANDEFTAGTYSINWNASGLSSGVYFYSIQAGNFSQTKKLLLVK
jgi:Secretion system C-terminal sorting domain